MKLPMRDVFAAVLLSLLFDPAGAAQPDALPGKAVGPPTTDAFTETMALDCQSREVEFRRRFDCACVQREAPRLRNARVVQAREASRRLIERDRNQLELLKSSADKYASREQYERMLSAVTERLKRHEDAGKRIGPESIDPSSLWMDVASDGICRSPKPYREIKFQECRNGQVTNGKGNDEFCGCYADTMAAAWETAGDISADAEKQAVSSCESSK